MKPPAFNYIAASSLEEATLVLAEHGDDAKVMAGGQSLIPMLNFRLMSPSIVIDISRIQELDQISESDSGLRIGALTSHRTLETSQAVNDRFPVLRAAMSHVAHLAIRNRGTIGGSLCHADPAAELPMMAVLLDAKITVVRSGGSRVINAVDFFESALTPTLEDDEIVTHIDFPALPAGMGWGFREFSRRSGDFGVAGVAAMVARSDGKADQVRIALLGVGETPLRARAAEMILDGSKFEDSAIGTAIEAVRETLEPNNDLHASADYRRHLAGVLTKRALTDAWRRAKSGSQ